jgi:menaquinone-dependent protoporphyrinogen oxidase
MTRILVAYASRSGFTAGVAEAIGRWLAEGGLAVDVRPVAEVRDVAPYQAVVAGSAIHGSKWLPEAMRFVREQRESLGGKPFACFSVCMALAMSGKYRQAALDTLRPVRALLRPASEGAFAGGVDPGKLRLIPEGLVVRGIVASRLWQVGDYRDWAAIRAWAEALRPALR